MNITFCNPHGICTRVVAATYLNFHNKILRSGYKMVIVVTSDFHCHIHVLYVWGSSQWTHLVWQSLPSFLPSSRVLKNGKSLLKYVGRKEGSSSALGRSNKNGGRSSWTWICCLCHFSRHLRMVHPCGCLFGIQESSQRSHGKRSALPFAYLQKSSSPKKVHPHIYILITYHSPTQPIGNPYPPSKNLVL
jgi:hypothetical protein